MTFILLLATITSTEITGDQRAKVLDRLLLHEQTWSQWKSDIRTAKIAAHSYLVMNSDLKSLSPSRVRLFLDRLQSISNRTRNFDQYYHATQEFIAKEPSWSQLTIFVNGDKVRSRRMSPKGDVIDNMYRDGFQLDLKGNPRGISGSQFTPGRSRMHIFHPSDFRWVPSIDLKPPYPDETVLHVAQDSDSGQVTLRTDDGQTSYSLPAGYPERRELFGDAGKLYGTFAWSVFNGVPFPRVSLQADFLDGKVTYLWLAVVEHASFNEPLDESAFIVSAPGMTHLEDHRTGKVWRIEQGTPDVMGLLLKRRP